MDIITPYGAPFFVTAKTVGARCNLRCDYCYYLEKSGLYKDKVSHNMSDEVLERFISDYISSQPSTEVMFAWHGGETLLRPLEFYEKVMELQKKHGQGHSISNSIQTNGTLLDDKWCKFFYRNQWLVGLSIDGLPDDHNRYRKTASGNPTFNKVLRGIELLNKHRVEWNILATVNHSNARRPLETYRFLRSLGTPFLQFTPVVERFKDGGALASQKETGYEIVDFSVTPGQWGDFLCTVFDEWVRNDVGKIYVQTFDATLANWVGVQPPVCTMARHCGNAVALEFNGDVYSCDHFVFPEYLLGNIREQSMAQMIYSERQQRFGKDKRDALPSQCKECRFLFACNGECPRNRFTYTQAGEPNLNYLCRGYYKFFEHVAPYMDFMKRELDAQRPPANIMKAIRTGEFKP